ncbi:MAG TPA: PqqD family protein [Caulobacteraceae bacterium]|jgi:hypothetical protein|nr:PqqD family protein [Caulobacteraceae bacterium]
MLQPDALLAPSGETYHAVLSDDEAVLMSAEAGRYFGLNAVGIRVWELLVERPRTIADLSAAISDEFDVEASTCQTDVLAFVQSLIDNGVLHEVER